MNSARNESVDFSLTLYMLRRMEAFQHTSDKVACGLSLVIRRFEFDPLKLPLAFSTYLDLYCLPK